MGEERSGSHPEPMETGPLRDRGLPPSPNGASSFHIWWDLPDVPLASVSVVLEVLTPPVVDRLAFFAIQASFSSGAGHEGGAHAGLQWNPRHPRSRAVNWGGYDRGGNVLSGTPSSRRSAPHDPNTRDFAWVPGVRYRLTIGPRTPGIRDPAYWPARVEGLDTGEDLVVRELICVGDHLRAPVVWSELFTRVRRPVRRSTVERAERGQPGGRGPPGGQGPGDLSIPPRRRVYQHHR